MIALEIDWDVEDDLFEIFYVIKFEDSFLAFLERVERLWELFERPRKHEFL